MPCAFRRSDTILPMNHSPLFLGADHAGFKLKEAIKSGLAKKGVVVTDLSLVFKDGDDYPAIGRRVALRVTRSANSRGLIVCGTGVGVAIAANRVKGIRAVDGHSVDEVKRTRNDENVNVLTLSGWKMKPAMALKMISAFLATPFSTAERHHRRVKQLG